MISKLIQSQKDFFKKHLTKEVSFRKEQLRKLKNVIQSNESLLYKAIEIDLNKSEFETFATELGILYIEIDEALKKLDKWSSKKRVGTSLANFPSTNYIYPEPLGVTLVISAWNYPIQLALAPVIASIAAGNTCIIKPSELAPKTSHVLYKIISENFESNYLAVVEGGIPENTELINSKFDHIFFTGSTAVGKIVYQAAATNLVPVTLELGGKSPAIIIEDCHLERAVQRIIWGKFLNAGQTCVAPDYVLVPENLKENFLQMLKRQISDNQYEIKNKNYTKIISSKHTERLSKLIQGEQIVFGGKHSLDEKDFEPTIILNPSFESAIMNEEIFGPILPIITYTNLDETMSNIEKLGKPLAAYLFTSSSKYKDKFLKEYSFGGGCINEVVMHLVNGTYGFGGVGSSGFGSYHGFEGFKTFSHFKSILDKPTWFELNLRYPKYSLSKLNWLKRIVKWSKWFG